MPFYDFHSMFMPERLHHTDDQGCPLFLNFLGQTDPDDLAHYPPSLAYIVESYLMEQALRAQERSSAALGRRITLLSVIIQCAGLSLAHRNMVGHLHPVLFIDDNIFPENMRQLIIINAPPFFTVLWALVKNLIDSQTRAKFVMLSPGDVQPVLDRIGVECTPKELGGKCDKCEGGGCVPKVREWEEGWRRVGRGTAKEVEQWEGEGKEELVKLAARHDHAVTFEVRRQGGGGEGVEERVVVWWSCAVDAKDVDFSLTCRATTPGDAPSYTLIAPTRHHSTSGPLRGCHHFTLFEAADDVNVTLTFSNHMSTFSGKQIRLRTGMRAEDVKAA